MTGHGILTTLVSAGMLPRLAVAAAQAEKLRVIGGSAASTATVLDAVSVTQTAGEEFTTRFDGLGLPGCGVYKEYRDALGR